MYWQSPVPGAAMERGNSLASHRFFMRVAMGAGNVFAWIFIFRGFYLVSGSTEASLFAVAIMYAMMQGIVLVLTPLSGFALRSGMRRALAYGTLLASFAFACFSVVFAPQLGSAELAFGLIVTFVVLMGIHRALYWVPYRTEVADIGTYVHASKGEEIILAFVPLAAALIIETAWLGPQALLALAALAALTALVPLIRIPESYEGFEWDFLESFKALFSRQHRTLLTISIADGIQGAALLLIWPLVAFIIIGQSFLGLGLILTLTFVLAPLLRSGVRKLLKRFRAERSTPIMASLVFSSWIFRLAAASPLQILVVDVYAHGGTSPKRFSIDAGTHEQVADGAHYVDEYTALKEMGLALGRIIACLVLAVVVIYTQSAAAFGAVIVLAAFASVVSIVVSQRSARLI
jgi:hypothetical protein